MKILRPCGVVTAFLLLLCGILYPALVTATAQVFFPWQAEGSLLEKDGHGVGSELLGQTFERPMEHLEYFWGRPSAVSVDRASKVVVSGGSNQGPLDASLVRAVRRRVALLRATGVTGPLPVDLVTQSASGLDPHLSPAAAELQVPRVARARGMREDDVRAIVRAHTEGRGFGFLGEPRVHVLGCNLALDASKKVAPVVSPDAVLWAPSVASPTPPQR